MQRFCGSLSIAVVRSYTLVFCEILTTDMGTISRPGGMRPKWHKKRIKRLKLRRRKMRQRSK
jgi:hypothetical protein